MAEQKNKKGSDQKKNKDQFKQLKDAFGAPSGNGKKPKSQFNYYWIYVVVGGILLSLMLFNKQDGSGEINLQEFEEMVKGDDVKKVIIYNKKFAEVFLTEDAVKEQEHKDRLAGRMFGKSNQMGPHYKFNIGPEDEFAKEIKALQKDHKFAYSYQTQNNWMDQLGWLIPIAVMVILWIFIMRRMGGAGGAGGQLFNIGKSRAQLFDENAQVKVNFKDVAGLEGAKEEVEEIVDFLKNPKKYTALGAKIPKGALLVGPPGTGKTLLAKAVAGEAGVPFFSLSGSDFVEMFVGVGASRVRDLFKQAKEKSPCIIFIDEIDAIGRARGKSVSAGANDERENTLNQLLTEMDGFGGNSGVIILAATNRADVLDRALLRPGRFDRQIHVDMPDLNERRQIFDVHLKPIKTDKTVDLDFLARQTPGFSGADIANICNEAALIAARKKQDDVKKQDFLDAVDRIIGGLEKKSKIISPQEKKVIAWHEAGHATVSWLLEYASPLVKVTIVPRGRSLGAAWYLPEERQITTTEQMQHEMCAALGGRAAEELNFGKISTGALSDLEKITKQAYAMVTYYGLNDKIGNVSFYDSSGQSEYNFSKPYSEQTAQMIDDEVRKIIDQAYKQTLQLLKDNKDKLDKLAEALLEREVIFKEDLEKIFGKRQYEDHTDIAQKEAEKKKNMQAEAAKAATEVKVENGSAPAPEEMPKDEQQPETPTNV